MIQSERRRDRLDSLESQQTNMQALVTITTGWICIEFILHLVIMNKLHVMATEARPSIKRIRIWIRCSAIRLRPSMKSLRTFSRVQRYLRLHSMFISSLIVILFPDTSSHEGCQQRTSVCSDNNSLSTAVHRPE